MTLQEKLNKRWENREKLARKSKKRLRKTYLPSVPKDIADYSEVKKMRKISI